MQVNEQLIRMLADGHFHSGEALGAELAVTRAAVWKQMRSLADLGLEVQAVRGRGYRLSSPLELFDRDVIDQAIPDSVRSGLHRLDLFHTLDSTSDYLKKHFVASGRGSAHACLAEWQRAGRGRRGRHWVSAYGSNIYLSLARRFDTGPGGMGGLSLAAGIAVLRVLQAHGVHDVGLKWPNDLVSGGGKLAGILFDMAGESGGPYTVIVGVGVNMKMPKTVTDRIDQAWSDLSDYEGRISRNQLAGSLLAELLVVLEQFSEQGLAPFLDEWQQHDLVTGREIKLHTGNKVIRGTACGIDEQGALKVNEKGNVRAYHAGEISVRLTP